MAYPSAQNLLNEQWEPKSNEPLVKKVSSKRLLSNHIDDFEDGEEIDAEVEGLCFEDESHCRPIGEL